MAVKKSKKSKAVENTKKEANVKPLSVKKVFTKPEIIDAIAERVEIKKKLISDAIDILVDIMAAYLSKKGVEEFVFPGVAKFKVVKKPARKARKGVNPFTGKETIFAAKPARKVIKVKPMKKLKDKVI